MVKTKYDFNENSLPKAIETFTAFMNNSCMINPQIKDMLDNQNMDEVKEMFDCLRMINEDTEHYYKQRKKNFKNKKKITRENSKMNIYD